MTAAEARALFARERAAFARLAPDVARARLVLSSAPCTAPRRCRIRDVAYADWERLEVVMLRRVLALPRAQVVGLMRHELGHLADPHPDRRGAEQRADDIAEAATGRRIKYAPPNAIQTTGTGTYPRPRWLHR